MTQELLMQIARSSVYTILLLCGTRPGDRLAGRFDCQRLSGNDTNSGTDTRIHSENFGCVHYVIGSGAVDAARDASISRRGSSATSIALSGSLWTFFSCIFPSFCSLL